MLLRTISPYSHSSFTFLQLTPKPSFATTHHLFSRLSAVTLATSAAPPAPHPWPEWVSFVDRLKSRGYFPYSSSDDEPDLVYTDLKLLKDPCLSFARDRFDIFESLSKNDIQRVVEVGCPELIRKVVNSAKRLRVYVGLQEKTVCDACSLKESCTRAYIKPSESETGRTVDIMRLLLFYALDPMVISESVRRNSTGRAEFSAKKLLLMLIDLSDTPKDPDYKEKIANSAVEALSGDTKRWEGEWVCPKCNFSNFSRNTQCLKCSGDWNCPKCQFLNFARNNSCRQCNEDAPKKREQKHVSGDAPKKWERKHVSEDAPKKWERKHVNEDASKKRERKHVEPKSGDWYCPKCSFLNYSKNMQCRECEETAPEKRESRHVEPKKGDWDCPQCAFVNFASRSSCYQCSTIRPPQRLNYGEWVCSKCSFLNFRRNAKCLKCDEEQDKDTGALHEQRVWKKPILATEK